MGCGRVVAFVLEPGDVRGVHDDADRRQTEWISQTEIAA
jgi:hypothetical protein